MSVKEMFAYWLAQCIGAALAALLSATLFPTGEAVHIAVGPAFLAETVFTFILVTVVLNTATSQDNAGNSFYGLAIGATVFAGAATVGSISGGGFNPAVALGLSVSGQFGWSNLWLYILAPLIGGALAGLVFRIFNAHDLVIDPE
jgi:aquaporin Z